MLTAYEIGAVLDIVDRASPKLDRILGLSDALTRSFDRLQLAGKGLFAGIGGGGLTAQLKRLNETLPVTLDRLGKLGTVATSSFRDFEVASTGALGALRTMNGELRVALGMTRALGGAGRGVAAGFAAGGRGGGHSGGEGVRVPSPVPAPFGGHLSSRSSIGLVAGGAAAYGAYEEGLLRDTAARMLFLAGQPLSADMAHTEQFAAIRKILLDTYTSTGADLADIEEGGIGVIKLMAGFPLEQRLSILKKALTFGAQEHRLNPSVSVKEGTDALVGLLHMTGVYDAELIDKLAPKIGALSTITNMPLNQVMRAASYAMPVAQANIGVDADQILLLMTAMQRAGVTSTKSGTWLREALTKTVGQTFTLTKHGSEAQKEGLRALGLIDANGKSTVFDAAGNLDIFKELGLINEAKTRLKGPDFLRFTRQAFGVQGSEGIGVLTEPQIIAQLPQMREWMNTMAGGETFFKDLFDASPAQAAKNTLAEFNRTLMDLGSTILPSITENLKKLDAVLGALNRTLESFSSPSVSKSAVSYGLAGAAALAFGPTRRLIGGALRFGGRAIGAGRALAGGAAAAGGMEGTLEGLGFLPGIIGTGGLPAAALAGAVGASTYYGSQYIERQTGGKVAWVDPMSGAPTYQNPSDDHIVKMGETLGAKIKDVVSSLLGHTTVELDKQTVGKLVVDGAARDAASAPDDSAHGGNEVLPGWYGALN